MKSNPISEALRAARKSGLSYEEAAAKVVSDMRLGGKGTDEMQRGRSAPLPVTTAADGLPEGWRIQHDPAFDATTNQLRSSLGQAPIEAKPWWLYFPNGNAVGGFATRDEAAAWACSYTPTPEAA